MKLAQHFASLIITTKYVQYSAIRQFNRHVNDRFKLRFVKIENEQIKTSSENSYG